MIHFFRFVTSSHLLLATTSGLRYRELDSYFHCHYVYFPHRARHFHYLAWLKSVRNAIASIDAAVGR